MPRPDPRLISLAALLSLSVAGCQEKPALSAEPKIRRAAQLSPVEPIAPQEKPRSARPTFTLPPQVADALQGIEWEPLDFLEFLPKLAYAVEPGCRLKYADLGTISLSDSNVGVIKQSFYEPFTLEPAGPGRMIRRPGKRLEFMSLEMGRGEMSGFLDTSRLSPPPIPLEITAKAVKFPSVLSPIFQLRTGNTVGEASPVNVWPPLPDKGEPTQWQYNLLFDKPEDLASRPPAKVEFVGWIRLGFQRAAYLTATWSDGSGSLPIGPDLAHMKIQGRRPRSSTLSQLGELTGHYLVSEQGHLLLGNVEGTARIRNVFAVEERSRSKGKKRFDYEVDEDRNFSFTTKLLEDCNGSLFSKVESEELTDAEVAELLERFASLMEVDRPKEAAELLSPAIRYAFPEATPLTLIKETFDALGSGFLGEPVAEKPGEEKPGVDLVGKSKKTRRSYYSTARGVRIAGQPYLTFVGSSSRRDRAKWDVLSIEPGNIHSGVVRVFRP